MPTSDWSIPTGKAITGATYIKDTDDYISATIEDLVDWCNNANGAYNDWTLTGLRTDFLSVSTAQAITSVKTIDTLGAIDFTNGELRIGGVAVTSTAAELNILDGVTSTTSELNILDGVTATATEINVLDGIPATLTATELGYVDGVTSSIQTQINGKASLTGATFTGQAKGITPVSDEDLTRKDYVDGAISTAITAENITSGTYTPTLIDGSNVASSVARLCHYIRVGNEVNVTGQVTVVATSANTLTGISIGIPVGIGSQWTSAYQAGGNIATAISSSSQGHGKIEASTSLPFVVASLLPTSTSGMTYGFTFSYQVT